MDQTKKLGWRRLQGGFYALLTDFANENRFAFRWICFMIALGMLFAVVITTVPQASTNLVRVSLGGYRAGRTVEETQIRFLNGENAAADVTTPELEAAEEMLRQLVAADEIRLNNLNGTGAFSAYCTEIPYEEAKEKLEALEAAKARAEAVAAARASVTVNTGYTNYVRLNTRGVPMSQKGDVEVDANGVPLHYRYMITGKGTAYYSGYVTATGTRPMQGTVAVDPREIPYGTRMYITSADGRIVYGLAVAEDTGGFIYYSHGATVDLYMYSYDDCVAWGWRSCNIYILD